MLRTFAVALLAIGLSDWLRRRCTSTCRVASWASQRLQHVSVVSHLPVNQCYARRGNGVIGNGVSARRKAFYTNKAASS